MAIAAHAQGRDPAAIAILAVSKGQDAQAIRAAFSLGLVNFGESYWQEAKVKLAKLADVPITWHFIGKLQTNKLKDIAQHFSWVHSVTREVELVMLAKHRPVNLPPLQICLEVQVKGALSKSGVLPQALPPLVQTGLTLPNIKLRGLMIMLDPKTLRQDQEKTFVRTKELLTKLNIKYNTNLDTLSMGMSNDFQAAIKAGSTMVRLGRSLFNLGFEKA